MYVSSIFTTEAVADHLHLLDKLLLTGSSHYLLCDPGTLHPVDRTCAFA